MKIDTSTIILVVLLMLGALLIWQRFDPPQTSSGIPPEVYRQLDSLKDANYNLETDKKQAWDRVTNIENEIESLRDSLRSIEPRTVKNWKEYQKKTVKEKEKVTMINIARMKKEMEGK